MRAADRGGNIGGLWPVIMIVFVSGTYLAEWAGMGGRARDSTWQHADEAMQESSLLPCRVLHAQVTRRMSTATYPAALTMESTFSSICEA